MTAFDTTPLIIGHRGAAGLLPENTLPSFQRAAALGVDAVELDVHCCEGRLVVIHDDTVERTTNGRGAVAAMSLAELRALDAGAGNPVPFLEEVLNVVPGHVGVNIELKGPGTAELLARHLPKDGGRSILVSSFDHRALAGYTRLRADHPVAPLFGRWRDDPLATAAEFGGGFINLGRKLVTKERVDRILDAGLKLLVYTVNELEDARRLFELGVWGVFTDFPDKVSRAAL
jgi:glycerophosphoryl diester phosphodiesterase